MILGTEIVVANILEHRGFRRRRKPIATSRNDQRFAPGAVSFHGSVDWSILITAFDNRNSRGIADERINIPIFRRGFQAKDIGVDQNNLADRRLFQKKEGLD